MVNQHVTEISKLTKPYVDGKTRFSTGKNTFALEGYRLAQIVNVAWNTRKPSTL